MDHDNRVNTCAGAADPDGKAPNAMRPGDRGVATGEARHWSAAAANQPAATPGTPAPSSRAPAPAPLSSAPAPVPSSRAPARAGAPRPPIPTAARPGETGAASRDRSDRAAIIERNTSVLGSDDIEGTTPPSTVRGGGGDGVRGGDRDRTADMVEGQGQDRAHDHPDSPDDGLTG